MSVTVLGAGSWGTTFAKILADAVPESPVKLWGRNPERVAQISQERRNESYLPGIELPENLAATTDLEQALSQAELVVVAIPAQSLREQLRQWQKFFSAHVMLVSLMKGLERGTDATASQIMAEELALAPEQIAVISGPNLALEIAQEQPTASVIAGTSATNIDWLAKRCRTPYFRPYTNRDVTGVEMGGIVKNVIALAVGICAGQGMGNNTAASLITRGLAETTKLATTLGAKPATLAGLAGLGDLVATCASDLSRNHMAGKLLGQGMSVAQLMARKNQTAEGLKSARAVYDLAQRQGVTMPITTAVVEVLEERLAPQELATYLMARELESEDFYESPS